MGFDITVDDVNAQVEALQEEFDVFEFVQQAKLPEDDVTVYTDADAALRIARILEAEKARDKQEQAEGLSLVDEFEDETTDEDEFTALHARLTDSGLTFHLRGLAPAAFAALEKHLRATHGYKEGAQNTEYIVALNNALVAKSIVSVTSATGKVRKRAWTEDEVESFTDVLYGSEANKLYLAAQTLTYIMDIFDQSVSADFS